jgi:hypothetical protein
MNADKTDISNTTGPGITRPVLYFQGKTNWKANLLEIPMLKSKDLRGGKTRDITESLSDGSITNPTRVQKVTTGKQPPRPICRGTRESRDSAGDPSIN